MLVFRDPQKLQRWALKQREAGVRVGLVPTMGYLHEGHLSLIAAAKKYADAVVVSVFVNPIQFGPNEDFEKYPRDEKADLAKCRAAGAAAVFLPTPQTMYAPDASVHVTEEVLANRLCGLRRPGHFRGVCTVVAKLFNLAQPNVAVFGQKDFQQACVIRRMVRDLNFPIRIVVAPIVREPDGLARSSRNTYLSETERQQAVGLSRSLHLAKRLFREGQTSAKRIVARMVKSLEADGLQVDYVEIVDAETLDPVKTVQKGNAVLLAVYDGKTRLIDNCLFS
ncbi:MAG: pantoate--beta-alanine ligase [Kiritimatiellae bacterium]|nr:pantoate--beta-alanine ligase [Kiritimatiellia bacterium]